jgi:phosphohistidine phosphatase
MTNDARSGRRQLVLVRHAKSSWDEPGLADHDRPLAPRGRKALRRMREHLDELAVRPDMILCSSALRTRETLAGLQLGAQPVIELEDGLYGASADDLLARLRRLSEDVRSAMVIGHNPGVQDLVDLLTEGDDAAPFDGLPTGAIALLSLTGSWHDLGPSGASLDNLWRPRPAR